MKIVFSKHSLAKLHLNRWFKLLPIFTGVLLLGLTALSLVFLHRNFYQTIAQLRIVSVLQNQVAFNQVNLTLYQSVFSSWENKKKFDPTVLEGFRDPFQALAKPAAAPPPSPTIEEVNTTP